MSRIVITVQEKGGVGKSTTMLEMCDFLRASGHDFLLADLDYEPRILSRFDSRCALLSPDVQALRARESNVLEFVELALKGENILVDCGANTFPVWDCLFNEVARDFLPALKSNGGRLTIVVPVDHDVDAQQYFVRYDSLFPGATKILATIGKEVRSIEGFPAHPATQSIALPRMPSVLVRAMSRHAKPTRELSKMSAEDLGCPPGFATNANKQYVSEFSRIIDHLKP